MKEFLTAVGLLLLAVTKDKKRTTARSRLGLVAVSFFPHLLFFSHKKEKEEQEKERKSVKKKGPRAGSTFYW